MKFVAIGSKLVYLPIVLGGTAASHTCSGVGGGHFLIKKSHHGNRAALRDRTNGAVPELVTDDRGDWGWGRLGVEYCESAGVPGY